ncbi:PTS sugar transporter subunit IIA [Streptococcus anginosus]|uniref:BglG family transcription antiterminator n=1 Tax=Streptococcus anginosus TaxID=1328 RepID=UPI0009F1A753|nr:PTS sugar transporter subunit IIA [Streptococcus anginosus]MDU4548751.1 PTS sugar transporter subunit IIA [Clostridium botulinum]MCW1004580.1 PTS sugar transporter subunit IIA [Streptococcus anginosus]MCW1058909.1 PTS sugar transporter subunit IIA [Streptococcus anginosus]MDB8649130.1 PTS sugar transporter subunit IIA [Streptococcus anginosus]MDI7736381.1 PTS sugar transporter subunit IIA [Streptococcus anginosus]
MLKILSKHDGPISSRRLSDYLQVSRRTVFKDIDSLRLIANKYNIDIINIPSKGIELKINNPQDILNLENKIKEKIYRDNYSVENRRVYIIKQLYLTNNDLTLDYLSEEYLVSKTSIYNDIKVINKVIEGYGSKIVSNISGIELIGNEINIQRSLIELIFHYSDKVSYSSSINKAQLVFFDKNIVNSIYEELFLENKSLIENLPDYYIQSFLTLVFTLCSRVKIDRHIGDDFKYVTPNFNNYDSETVKTFVDFLIDELDLNLKAKDIAYLKKQIYAHRLVDKPINDKSDNNFIVNKFIGRISKIEGVDFSNNEELVKAMSYHISAMVERLKLGIHIQNPLLKSLRKEYKTLFSIIWYSANILEDYFKIKMNDDEVALILIYFQIQIEASNKANNILIVCQYGISCAQLIYNKVKGFLPEKDNLLIRTLDELSNSDLSDVDFIISSINLDYLNLDIPYVFVNPVINNDDYIKIISEYTKIFSKRYQIRKNEKNNEDVSAIEIDDLISLETIFLRKEFKNKEELIEYVGNSLNKNKFVDYSYLKSIFTREAIGITALEYGVALPHASSKTVNRTHIAICTLSHPIDWDGIPTSLVIFMNFEDDEVENIRYIVDKIYKKINSKEKVDKLVGCKKPEELIEEIRSI